MRFVALVLAILAGIASPAFSDGVFLGGVPAMTLSGTPTVTGSLNIALVPFTVTASYAAPPVTYSLVSGTFPTGVTLNATTGVVSGTPSQSGTFSRIVIGAEDSWAPVPHRTAQLAPFDLIISSPTNALTVAVTPPARGTVGVATTPFSFVASGGTGPYTYALYSRYFPTSVTMTSGGVVSGTPTVDGTYTDIIVRATDSLGAVGNSTAFTWIVDAASPAVAATLSGTTPTNFLYYMSSNSGKVASGAIRTMHGLTLQERASANPVELDANGFSIGTEWYGYTMSPGYGGSPDGLPNWPPGYPTVPPYTTAPLVVNQGTTNYPFRYGASTPGITNTFFLRGGLVQGSISHTAEQVRLAMYPLTTVQAGGIIVPPATNACYDGADYWHPTWSNVTATGAIGATTITTAGAPVNTDMFIGEEVYNPVPGVGGIQAGTTITSLSAGATHTIGISLPLTAAITKGTFRGCTAFYNNSAGLLLDQLGTATVTGTRLDHVWDGIRTCGGVDHNGTAETTAYCINNVTGVWMTHCRDDCLENDRQWTLNVTDSLFDGGFDILSADGSQAVSAENTIAMTLTGVLMRVDSRPDIANNSTPPYADYGIPFKLGSLAPSIVLHSTIIAVDNAGTAHASRYVTGWQRMTNSGTGGLGSCTDSTLNSITGLTGNYFLWLDDSTPTTAQIGAMATPGSTVRNCFTYQTGATARATWAAAKAAWQVAHPQIYRLSSDP